MSTDAIVILKNDHKDIRKAFSDFEKAGENAHATKGKVVDRIIELLTTDGAYARLYRSQFEAAVEDVVV